MKRTSLELLACPACQVPLGIQAESQEWIESGRLHCEACQKDYPISGGIPHFVSPKELNGLNRRFAKAYDRFSWGYSLFSRFAFMLLGIPEETGRREILDRLDLHGGCTLEISIGPGVNLPFIMNRSKMGDMYGLDISLGQLQRCKSYARRMGWAVDLFHGNAEALPFRNEVFDTVFHIGGINFFNDKKAAIEEMIRVAKPGTRIIIADENEKGARAYEKTIPGFKQSFTGERQAVTAPVELIPAGMQEIQIRDVWKGWFYCLEFQKPLQAK